MKYFQRGGLPLLSRGIDENIFQGVNILFIWCLHDLSSFLGLW